MIKVQTYLKIVDNTGVKKILCIRLLGTQQKIGIIGNCIIGSIKYSLPKSAFKKSDIVRGLIIRTRKPLRRLNGSRIYFRENAVILINKENNPIGTRIFGPILNEIRLKGFTKVASIASEII
uniref:Large ribosomal subunit protein uL14c n=1 Tax=Pteridomonas danica TaxID=38822 RepID=A0A7T1C525_9STRA|nr:ribosomal protein L14 [Pteridomonas danica]QPM99296.1 ribosomal protein L14 [Pteridomonas danica]